MNLLGEKENLTKILKTPKDKFLMRRENNAGRTKK